MQFINIFSAQKRGHQVSNQFIADSEFQVSRKALFYQCWLVTPTLILVMIVIIVFYLPVEAGEKMGLSMFTMMSLPMPLMLCSKFMSSGGQTTPMLVLYTYFGMILSSASVMSSVIVVNVHYRAADTHKMQPWVKKLFVDFLPKYLRMERPSTRADRKKKKLQKFLDRLNLQNNLMSRQGFSINEKRIQIFWEGIII